MIYTVSKRQTYIPKWNGNRKLPDDEQIKVVLGFPSVAEIAEYANEYNSPNLFNFKLYVKEVKNLKIKGEDGKTKDATVDDLINTEGLIELFSEIKTESERLNSIDKKK